MDEGGDAPLLSAVRVGLPAGDTVAPLRIGVAVSGGGDSLALLLLVVRLARDAGWSVHAVTVDHGLRAASGLEAAAVGDLARRLGASHDTLHWTHGGRIDGNLMEAAREARYRLMGDWARGRGIGHVALGHTADDQAETFLMGLARSAGLDGLTGMRPRFAMQDVTFHRPLLAVGRADLRAYLKRHGQTWVDDPSNEDDRFTRVRARQAMQALRPLGITPARLTGVIAHLSAARAAMEDATAEAAARIGQGLAGAVILDRPSLQALHPELARRVLLRALMAVSAAPHPPREAGLARLMQAVNDGRHATLHGCRIRVTPGALRILREPRAMGPAVAIGALWDGRWRLLGPEGGEVRALGADGLAHLARIRAKGAAPPAIPRDILAVTPAVWRMGALVSVPLAGWGNGWHAELRFGADLFPLSPDLFPLSH